MSRLFAQKSATPEESEKALAGAQEGRRAGRCPGSRRQADEGQCRRDQGDDRHDAPVRPFRRHRCRKARGGGRSDRDHGDELFAGPHGRGHDRQSREDGCRDRHLRGADVAGRDRPTGRGVRECGPVEALSRPAAPGDPDGGPDPRNGQGEGRDPRPRRQALSRAGGDRAFPSQQVGPWAAMPITRLSLSASRPFSRKTATTSSGLSGPRTCCGNGRSRWRRRTTHWRGSSRASSRANRSCSIQSRHSAKTKPSGSPINGSERHQTKGFIAHGRDAVDPAARCRQGIPARRVPDPGPGRPGSRASTKGSFWH